MADKSIAEVIAEGCRLKPDVFRSDAEVAKVAQAVEACRAATGQELLPTSGVGRTRYPVSSALAADLTRRFTYHPPKPGQPELYTLLRLTLRDAAFLLAENVPPGRELSLAFTKLEEVGFWANAGVARGES